MRIGRPLQAAQRSGDGLRASVDREIAANNNQSYASAVATMERVGRLMSAAGRGEEFVTYVAGVRGAHRRKRNLMKLFTERGW